MREAYEGGLAGHFGEKRMLEALSEYFFWPMISRDVHRVVKHCVAYKKAKSKEMA